MLIGKDAFLKSKTAAIKAAGGSAGCSQLLSAEVQGTARSCSTPRWCASADVFLDMNDYYRDPDGRCRPLDRMQPSRSGRLPAEERRHEGLVDGLPAGDGGRAGPLISGEQS